MGMELNAEQIRYLNNGNNLYSDYIVHNKTINQILRETGISKYTITSRIREHKIRKNKKYKDRIKK